MCFKNIFKITIYVSICFLINFFISIYILYKYNKSFGLISIWITSVALYIPEFMILGLIYLLYLMHKYNLCCLKFIYDISYIISKKILKKKKHVNFIRYVLIMTIFLVELSMYLTFYYRLLNMATLKQETASKYVNFFMYDLPLVLALILDNIAHLIIFLPIHAVYFIIKNRIEALNKEEIKKKH